MNLNTKKWKAIAKHQLKAVFTPDDATLKAQAKAYDMKIKISFIGHRLADTYNLDTLQSLFPEQPKCAKCGEDAVLRCSRCQNAWYCRRWLQPIQDYANVG